MQARAGFITTEYTEVMTAWRVVNNIFFMRNPIGGGVC